VNPAELQVLISQLTGIAAEMGDVLRRSSLSPNIKERADCSAALFTGAGELLVQAEHIPVHLGSMPASVAAAIGAGLDLRPGAQVVLNDPFAGGTHLNDLTLVAPCYVGSQLVGWVANRAHHADVGGMAPGSIPPRATEIYQEGLRIPPVLLTPGVAAILEANSRAPVERRGDLHAQAGANRVGVERLAALAGRLVDFDEVVDYGERRMRAALLELPDGTWTAEDVLDSTGPATDQQRQVTIRLALTIEGSEATFDFRGTDSQRPGNVNAVAAVTASAVAWALRSVADPTIPANGGTQRPVRLIIPDGSVVGARPPAAVGAGNVEVSQRVADVCLLALAQAAPDRVGAAGQGTMNNLILGGRSGWVYYETIGGGQGGRPGSPGGGPGSPGGGPGHPGRSGVHTAMTNTGQVAQLSRAGMSGIHTAMTNTSDTPTEALERAYPMRVLRYRLREGSGGRGQAPGGDGIDRVIQLLEPATLSLITERRVSRPWGLQRGEPGASGENWLWPGGDESERILLGDKVTVELETGDAVQVLTPGGGGWGTPRDSAR